MNIFFSKAIVLILIIVSSGCNKVNELILDTDSFQIRLNENGQFSKLIDSKNNTNYLFEDNAQNSILSIQINGEFESPAFGNFNNENEIIMEVFVSLFANISRQHYCSSIIVFDNLISSNTRSGIRNACNANVFSVLGFQNKVILGPFSQETLEDLGDSFN